MTKEESEKYIKSKMCNDCGVYLGGGKCSDNCKVIEAIEAFEELDFVQPHKKMPVTLDLTPCDDAVSRQAVIDGINRYFHDEYYQRTSIQDCRDCLIEDVINKLPPVNPQQKIGYCRDCKWWKDSDGAFRRGIEAESQCPMNRIEVYEGNGYCYMFEPQERNGEE